MGGKELKPHTVTVTIQNERNEFNDSARKISYVTRPYGCELEKDTNLMVGKFLVSKGKMLT